MAFCYLSCDEHECQDVHSNSGIQGSDTPSRIEEEDPDWAKPATPHHTGSGMTNRNIANTVAIQEAMAPEEGQTPEYLN